MKIKSITTEIYEEPIPVYDVINANPYNNFLVKSGDSFIVSHNCIMDELNFSNAPKGSKNSVLDMYRNIRRRLESRFLKQGRIPGFLFLVSSKNTEYDFLEQYIQTIKGNKTAYIIDKAVYEIKPPETYVGTKFRVAVGDKTKSSRIIGDLEDVEAIKSLGYQVIEVPTEYRIAFEQDINDALKDIAGISSVSTSKLIPYAGKIEACVNRERRSPLLVDEITLSLETNEDIKDYLDDLRILKRNLHIPRFGHIDIGLKGDSLGFCLVHAANTVSVQRYSKSGQILSFNENKYVTDLELRIRPLSGSEVPLYKVREFILYLVTTLGINIQMLTFDGFQSSDSIQLLKTAGMNVGLLSVDRTDEQYLNLRSCILEGRLDIYDQPTLIKELYELDHDIKNKKVDHPIDGCFSGDTKLYLVNNSKYLNDNDPIEVSFEELCSNYDKYKDYKVVSYNHSKQCTELVNYKSPRITKYVTELLEIELETGDTIKCTPEHRFLLTDGSYKIAKDLTEDDDIMEPFINDISNKNRMDSNYEDKI